MKEPVLPLIEMLAGLCFEINNTSDSHTDVKKEADVKKKRQKNLMFPLDFF